MRNIIATMIVLVATSAAAQQRCPSIDRPERPQFSHPLPDEIVTDFRSQTRTPDRLNTDIVYAATAGDAVRAAADGQVDHVQPEGTGQRLTVRHAQGYSTGYLPMREIAVGIGDCISAGDILGRAVAPLRFELMIHGRMVDPVRVRGGLPAR